MTAVDELITLTEGDRNDATGGQRPDDVHTWFDTGEPTTGTAEVPALVRASRALAVAITAAIAVSSFILSFAALSDLARRTGSWTGWLPYLWPGIVDGAIVLATMGILATAAYYGYESYALFANRWVDPTLVASSVEEQVKSGWHASLAEGLEVAKRENKPVLIDMWATWCKNCLTMDKTTLANDDVKAALSNYVKVKYQAEDPDAQPARGIMQKFSAPGLPAYAILKPKT